jgi:hypothetical protein
VFKQRLSVCDMTPPMRNPPARRLEERGRRGWWPRFPSSPQDPHDRLRALLGLERLFVSSAGIGWDATQDLAGDVDRAAGAAADLRLADSDRAGALAVVVGGFGAQRFVGGAAQAQVCDRSGVGGGLGRAAGRVRVPHLTASGEAVSAPNVFLGGLPGRRSCEKTLPCPTAPVRRPVRVSVTP